MVKTARRRSSAARCGPGAPAALLIILGIFDLGARPQAKRDENDRNETQAQRGPDNDQHRGHDAYPLTYSTQGSGISAVAVTVCEEHLRAYLRGALIFD